MIHKKFTSDDLFYNTVVTYPEFQFIVQSGKVYLNREVETAGDFGNKIKHAPQGSVNLYELNINRPADTETKNNLIYPFVTKDGARTSFRTISTNQFQDSSQYNFGDVIKGSYPLTASISRIYVKSGIEFDIHNHDDPITTAPDNKKYIRALRNSLENSNQRSAYYFYSSSMSTAASANAPAYKGTCNVNLVCIPSIFYGSGLQKGSIQLDYFITGALCAQLKDSNKNGELIEQIGANAGKVAGVALYEQGILVLTGSYDLPTTHTENFFSAGAVKPSWLSYGSGMSEVGQSSGYIVTSKCTHVTSFRGTNKIPTLTMLAHAKKGELNYSHNPTYCHVSHSITSSTSNNSYTETPGTIKNIKKSRFEGYDEEFEPITYISKIGIYDEDRNLIAIASLANPVKKTELREYTFKLRLDF